MKKIFIFILHTTLIQTINLEMLLTQPQNFGFLAHYIYFQHKALGVEKLWAAEVYSKIRGLVPSNSQSMIIDKNNTIVSGCDSIAITCLTNKPLNNFEISNNTANSSLHFEILKDKIPEADLDALALEFCKIHSKAHIVIIWPKALSHTNYITDTLKKYGTIHYAKKITVKGLAPAYILQSIPEKAGTLDYHLSVYFNNQSSAQDLIIVLCTFPSFESTVTCKQNIRKTLKLNPEISALHIADDQQQSMQLARIFFNNNSLNFINSLKGESLPPKFSLLFNHYKKWLQTLSLNQDYFCIDGSAVLAAFGLRDINVDFDFLSYYENVKNPSVNITFQNQKLGPIELHNDAWKHCAIDPLSAIFNPRNHFYFNDIKLTSLQKMREFKFKQNRPVDQADVKKIDTYIQSLGA